MAAILTEGISLALQLGSWARFAQHQTDLPHALNGAARLKMVRWCIQLQAPLT